MRDSLVSMVDGRFSNSRPYVSTLGIAGTVADGYPRCGKEFTCRKYIEKKKRDDDESHYFRSAHGLTTFWQ